MTAEDRHERQRQRQLRKRESGTAEAKKPMVKSPSKASPKSNALKKEPVRGPEPEKEDSKSEMPNKSSKSNKSVDGKKKHRRGHGAKRLFNAKTGLFIIGTILGLLCAHLLANHDTTMELAGASQEWLLMHQDMLPSSLVDVLKHAQVGDRNRDLSDDFAVGIHMHQEGFQAKHPVIMVPGVISSALENWGLHGTEECPSKQYYRKQLWGGFYMIRTMLLNKTCWLKHLLLDEVTGMDPPDFKVRAAQGIESADYFITGYWIWNKIIENLSALGYDETTMTLASYDWRLGFPDLERRDGYFSNLKANIETKRRLSGQKVSLVSHSMGSQVAFYFLKWAEAEGREFGNGGPNWVNDNIAHFVDISGSMLGTPKALVALLSGEMRDTVTLNQLAVSGLEKFFSRDERAYMLRTWPGIASMLPKGGNVVWGDMQHAPDDPPFNSSERAINNSISNSSETFGNFLRFSANESNHSIKNMTLSDAMKFLYKETPEFFRNHTQEMYSYGIAKTRKEVEANNQNPRAWSNPLEAALPDAPDLKVYALYGVGKSTERAYFYRDSTNDSTTPLNAVIDYDSLERGSVVNGEGDGTIALPCHSISYRWKDKNSKFNPGHANVTIVEMLHKPNEFDLRGGSQTADHVDILGRTELNELLCRIVSGNGTNITDRYISNINKWVWDLDFGTDN